MFQKLKRRKMIWIGLLCALSVASFAFIPIVGHWVVGRMLVGKWSTAPGWALVFHEDGTEELVNRNRGVMAFGRYRLTGLSRLVVEHQHTVWQGRIYPYNDVTFNVPPMEIEMEMHWDGSMIHERELENRFSNPQTWGKEEIWEKQ